MGARRVALKPHAQKIRRWVDEGRSDLWISEELNTTPSSVQSFRSRNSIYRRDPVRRGELSEHPAVLRVSEGSLEIETGAVDSGVFRQEWARYVEAPPEKLRVVVTRDRIYIEKSGADGER
ncbi:Hypothetical Protein RradSPS_1151 [Rubrobacter radiotolerans]|uniref:Uncharacterized protein n=1 Tax=Rubrobacter radiotolerans TaxID=42256 RepID=A0A023X2Y9_RUBRA|nr:hypothetical protein [Rubrobacter radiotolerans]AHY46434.1 Hypothetical Protein RradSPS_1151 [Rubrobacter radiotolerans]MDX5893841.1 hypothetical protein [Rubrobacter radiotolerans]SMC04603.1 conserved hypothetical protein [Rubrobacter radiotolerans DSM 5868]